VPIATRVVPPVVLAILCAVLPVGCSKKSSSAAANDAKIEKTSFSGAIALPKLNIEHPRALEPVEQEQTPVFYLLDTGDEDADFSGTIAIQPLTERNEDPHCGVSEGKEVERLEETPTPKVTLRRCTAKDGEASAVIDRRFDDAWDGAPFYCLASWHWQGPGPLPARWKTVADAIERSCNTLTVAPSI
jgi:hypothetical protein